MQKATVQQNDTNPFDIRLYRTFSGRVRVWYRHFDHKNPKLSFMFSLGFFVCADCLNLLSTQVESGSPSEQSREVLAHQRLRSVTSNKVAMLPVSRPHVSNSNHRDYEPIFELEA